MDRTASAMDNASSHLVPFVPALRGCDVNWFGGPRKKPEHGDAGKPSTNHSVTANQRPRVPLTHCLACAARRDYRCDGRVPSLSPTARKLSPGCAGADIC